MNKYVYVMYGSRLLHICENMWRFATCCKGGVTPPNVAAAALKRLGGVPPPQQHQVRSWVGGVYPPSAAPGRGGAEWIADSVFSQVDLRCLLMETFLVIFFPPLASIDAPLASHWRPLASH